MQKSILSYFTDDHLYNCCGCYWIIYSKTEDTMNTNKSMRNGKSVSSI